MTKEYTIIRIQKGAGKFRTIYAPHGEYKDWLKFMVEPLTNRCVELDTLGVMHAFMPGRSPVTNAMAHRGWRFTLSMDLSDWFDTVNTEHLSGFLLDGLDPKSGFCFIDGAPRQGLPTSPAIANIAGIHLDSLIMKHHVKGRFSNFVYTRYADDLTVSANSMDTIRQMAGLIPKYAEQCGFKVNQSKTHIQSAEAGRRMITGVAVDHKIQPSRAVKRRLRAARHQAERGVTGRNRQQIIAMNHDRKAKGRPTMNYELMARLRKEGLEEWSRLRLPEPLAKLDVTVGQTVANAITTTTSRIAAFFSAPFTRKFS